MMNIYNFILTLNIADSETQSGFQLHKATALLLNSSRSAITADMEFDGRIETRNTMFSDLMQGGGTINRIRTDFGTTLSPAFPARGCRV